ncbi:MAG: hypothetical protein ACFFD4_40080 [Candidatus Odinarchaeota archaeon]
MTGNEKSTINGKDPEEDIQELESSKKKLTSESFLENFWSYYMPDLFHYLFSFTLIRE